MGEPRLQLLESGGMAPRELLRVAERAATPRELLRVARLSIELVQRAYVRAYVRVYMRVNVRAYVRVNVRVNSGWGS